MDILASPWGAFDPIGSWIDNHFVWTPFSMHQWVGIIFFVVIFSTVFWLRPFYRFVGKHPSITISIGSIYLGMYLLYHILHSVYYAYVLPQYAEYRIPNPNGTWQTIAISNYSLLHYPLWLLTPKGLRVDEHLLSDAPIAPWNQFVPLHLTDLGQICASILLITRNKKLFDATMPIFAFMPLVSILSPEKVFWGYDNYFFWEFYFNHTMMLIVYWWFYLYGIKSYNLHSIRWSYIYLFVVAVIAFIYDYFLNTNLLYVGMEGWPLFDGVTTSNILTGSNELGVSLLSMTIFGVVMLTISYLIVIFFNPFYDYDKRKRIFIKTAKMSWFKRLQPFREFFIWTDGIFQKTRPGFENNKEHNLRLASEKNNENDHNKRP